MIHENLNPQLGARWQHCNTHTNRHTHTSDRLSPSLGETKREQKSRAPREPVLLPPRVCAAAYSFSFPIYHCNMVLLARANPGHRKNRICPGAKPPYRVANRRVACGTLPAGHFSLSLSRNRTKNGPIPARQKRAHRRAAHFDGQEKRPKFTKIQTERTKNLRWTSRTDSQAMNERYEGNFRGAAAFAGVSNRVAGSGVSTVLTGGG